MASFSALVAVRQFSTSVIRKQLIKPPVAVFGTEGRYAAALYSAAVKQKKLETVEKEMKEFHELLKRDKVLAEFLDNPIYNRQFKKDALLEILKKKKVSDLTTNTFGVLGDNGRLNKLNSVCNSFARIMSACRGEITCEITSAKPLDDGMLKEIISALQGFLKKGEVLQVKTQVDPAIIGGLILSIGDKYLDMSFSSKIKTYTHLIKEAI